MMKGEFIRPLYWDENKNLLMVLDQRRLPHEEVWLEIGTLDDLLDAIRNLSLRGAPLLGIAAAFGVYLGIRDFEGDSSGFISQIDDIVARIGHTRPTAINLFTALRRAQETTRLVRSMKLNDIKAKLLHLGYQISSEEETRCRSIAQNGADFLEPNVRILTHCNTGSLATFGIGTALGVIREAYRRGYVQNLLITETRPLLQGARLTAWELSKDGIPFKIITDGAAPFAIEKGLANVVIVGADRIARNGDVANKIGTYPLALAAKRHNIPFIVAAPTSSFDLSIMRGSDIPIEERNSDEVLFYGNQKVAPDSAEAVNFAFDITPAELITAIATERGVIKNPNVFRIQDHISGSEIFSEVGELL